MEVHDKFGSTAHHFPKQNSQPFWKFRDRWQVYQPKSDPLTLIRKSPRRDLNSRPLVYKTSALTPELRRRCNEWSSRQGTDSELLVFDEMPTKIFGKLFCTALPLESYISPRFSIAFSDENCTSLPWPGFEPGLLRPQRNVLTTIRLRPSRLLIYLSKY